MRRQLLPPFRADKPGPHVSWPRRFQGPGGTRKQPCGAPVDAFAGRPRRASGVCWHVLKEGDLGWSRTGKNRNGLVWLASTRYSDVVRQNSAEQCLQAAAFSANETAETVIRPSQPRRHPTQTAALQQEKTRKKKTACSPKHGSRLSGLVALSKRRLQKLSSLHVPPVAGVFFPLSRQRPLPPAAIRLFPLPAIGPVTLWCLGPRRTSYVVDLPFPPGRLAAVLEHRARASGNNCLQETQYRLCVAQPEHRQ